MLASSLGSTHGRSLSPSPQRGLQYRWTRASPAPTAATSYRTVRTCPTPTLSRCMPMLGPPTSRRISEPIAIWNAVADYADTVMAVEWLAMERGIEPGPAGDEKLNRL